MERAKIWFRRRSAVNEAGPEGWPPSPYPELAHQRLAAWCGLIEPTVGAKDWHRWQWWVRAGVPDGWVNLWGYEVVYDGPKLVDVALKLGVDGG
jgi:hypothetical protein